MTPCTCRLAYAFNTRALESPSTVGSMVTAADREEISDQDVDDGGSGTQLLSGYHADEDILPGPELEGKEERREAVTVLVEENPSEDQMGEEGPATEEELEQKYVRQGPTEAELTEVFIEQYVQTNRVTAGYRFTAVKQQVLGHALIEANMKHTVVAMMKMIREYITPPNPSGT